METQANQPRTHDDLRHDVAHALTELTGCEWRASYAMTGLSLYCDVPVGWDDDDDEPDEFATIRLSDHRGGHGDNEVNWIERELLPYEYREGEGWTDSYEELLAETVERAFDGACLALAYLITEG